MGVRIIDATDYQRFIWVQETPRIDGLSISPSYSWMENVGEFKAYTLVFRPEMVLKLARSMEMGKNFALSRTVILGPIDNTVLVHFTGRREGELYILSIEPRNHESFRVAITASDATLYGELLRYYAYDLFNRKVAGRKKAAKSADGSA